MVSKSNPETTKPRSEIEILTKLELYFSVRHTARSLRAFAELLDHDYDNVAIFLSVAEVCLQAAFHLAPIDSRGANIEQIYSQIAGSGLSVMTIAEITGIPRETVRRKIKKLIEQKNLALSETTNNVYLPASVVLSKKFFDVFRNNLDETYQLVRTVSFYSRGAD
jgi:hypothetical protein